MKKTIFLCFLLLVFIVTGNAQKTRPVAVSPGSESGKAVVGQSCPTFSWSAVLWTEAYRVVIFHAVGDEPLSYEEMEAVANPVLNKVIRGPALSWTPSENERLSNGGVYVWYVRSIDASGVGVWSEGRIFEVEVATRLVGLEEKLRERLREYGLSDEAITEVLNYATSGVLEVEVLGSGQIPPFTVGIQGYQGALNTFYGLKAGARNQIGLFNTFIGASAGRRNISGHQNTFLGYNAGAFNAEGKYNTFIGNKAGYNNTRSLFNTFIGNAAGYNNTTGSRNTFIGSRAGWTNTVGKENTFIGEGAGEFNADGKRNTFIGYKAGHGTSTGLQNVFIGHNAGAGNKTGSRNTIIGLRAGYNMAGNNNVFLGFRAGYYVKGSNLLYIDNSSTNLPLIYGEFDTSIVRINGKLGVGMSPNRLIDVFGGAYCDGTNWINASSRQYKENIENLDLEEAMDTLEGLEPVKFNYKSNKKERHVGFIAEEVPDLVATRDRKGMSAMDVVAVLTKVVQEQQKTIDRLCKQVNDLKKKK